MRQPVQWNTNSAWVVYFKSITTVSVFCYYLISELKHPSLFSSQEQKEIPFQDKRKRAMDVSGIRTALRMYGTEDQAAASHVNSYIKSMECEYDHVQRRTMNNFLAGAESSPENPP